MQIHLTELNTREKLGSYSSDIVPREKEILTINTRYGDDGETKEYIVTRVNHFFAAEEDVENISPFFVSILARQIE